MTDRAAHRRDASAATGRRGERDRRRGAQWWEAWVRIHARYCQARVRLLEGTPSRIMARRSVCNAGSVHCRSLARGPSAGRSRRAGRALCGGSDSSSPGAFGRPPPSCRPCATVPVLCGVVRGSDPRTRRSETIDRTRSSRALSPYRWQHGGRHSESRHCGSNPESRDCGRSARAGGDAWALMRMC